MTRLKLVLPGLILAGGLTIPFAASFAKPAYVRPGGPAAGEKCSVCHTRGKELNDVGKCFKDKQDLKACKTS